MDASYERNGGCPAVRKHSAAGPCCLQPHKICHVVNASEMHSVPQGPLMNGELAMIRPSRHHVGQWCKHSILK